ncbi:helix-turn-helix transcriptional regulator [Aestuariispira insulae]|uniref:Regulatory LuxR family protein n=1 Tax=Aestuariispira insulae TaxID=1461337 RepID=A0A3D9HT07_9PROT|nr:helix-turn-helix transcriptional regulator [Aestuariispira insulae]RED52006.1 regulatory LuxR family protein [Aestuariispira insulae]
MVISQKNLDLISGIYEIALDPLAWRPVLDQLCLETGAVAINTVLVDHTIPEIRINATSAKFTEAVLREFNAHHLENEAPAIMALTKYRPGEFISETQIYSDIGRNREEVSTTGWLRERFNIDYRVATRLNTDPAWLDCLTFHYSAERPFIREEEKRVIDLYRQHFARVIEINRPFTLLQSRFRAVLSVLDRFQIGTFILSEQGNIVVCNREAERILSLDDGLARTRDQQLVCRDEKDRLKLAQTVEKVCKTAKAERDDKGRLLTIGRHSEEDPFLVDIAPLRGSDMVLGNRFRGALVLVSDPGNHRELSADGLRLLYGLSEAEEAICRMVIEGLRNDEIAESRNVSLDTVKTQLKSLYAKTRTSHRIDLLRLAQNVNIPVDPPDQSPETDET